MTSPRGNIDFASSMCLLGYLANMISWKHNMTRKYELYKCTYIRDDTSIPGRICFTSSRLFTPMTLPFRSLIFTLPLYVQTWSKYLFFCNFSYCWKQFRPSSGQIFIDICLNLFVLIIGFQNFAFGDYIIPGGLGTKPDDYRSWFLLPGSPRFW